MTTDEVIATVEQAFAAHVFVTNARNTTVSLQLILLRQLRWEGLGIRDILY